MMWGKKIPQKLKCKIYKTVIRPPLLYGAEYWTLGKREEKLVTKTEMRMLRRIVGVTLWDKERNETIRAKCGVADITLKLREASLRWFDHVERRDDEEEIKQALERQVERKRRRGRPRKRWRDRVAEDMEAVGVTRMDVVDRKQWRKRTLTADPRVV